MKGLATITPTRGDREELLCFALDRIPASRESFIIDFTPKSDDMDLVPRIREGIRLAKESGYEYVFIMEDDDYYPKYFFDTIDFTDYDFFGYSTTHYYNIRNRTFQTMYHNSRSSLFCTGFKVSAMDKFLWPADSKKFLDIKIWEYANNGDFRVKLLSDNPCLGIKHGIGKCAGKGHTMQLENHDPDLYYLRKFVDDEAFKFYTDLMKKL